MKRYIVVLVLSAFVFLPFPPPRFHPGPPLRPIPPVYHPHITHLQ